MALKYRLHFYLKRSAKWLTQRLVECPIMLLAPLIDRLGIHKLEGGLKERVSYNHRPNLLIREYSHYLKFPEASSFVDPMTIAIRRTLGITKEKYACNVMSAVREGDIIAAFQSALLVDKRVRLVGNPLSF